ncbi:hypothetical protein ACFS5M_13390 [Lacinutrix iliipiscaria]|uniref:Uncharacterized protein n=1 Tax=Lacinutrix iliipiscaria TaxID=1230532 RepID=A0ABW5WQY7_9FLAO
MKIKFILFSLTFLLIAGVGQAQSKKNQPKSIINTDVSISKYHDLKELEDMQKGKLLSLYNERIEIIIKILPSIAFGIKPGVTMSNFGIPNTKDNREALEEHHEATTSYFENTISFQSRILPYSDKANLIAAILFYEQTLKSLHLYGLENKF